MNECMSDRVHERNLYVPQMLPGGQGARTYQDERFSWVVLRIFN